MIKKLFGRTISVLRWSLIVLAIFPISTAKADGLITVNHPTDFWFSYNETTHFSVRTYQSESFPSDPQLWLYDADTGQEIASNDDFYGLQSHIELDLPAGNYRLRAAVCCGNPNGWGGTEWGWNVQYDLSYTGLQSDPPTTTPETTTTWPETTTSTTTTTTTTTTVPETTVPATTEPPTTSTTTSTVVETTTTTTTVAPTVTSAPQTTSTVVITVAPTVAPSIPVTSTTNAPTVAIPPQVSSTSTTTTVVSTSTSTSIPESTSSSTSTTIPTTVPVDNGPQISEEEIVNLTDEELDNLVESIEVSELTEESIAAVFSEEVLSELTDDQVVELIDAIVPEELSEEQALALSEALTNAPDDVKEEFESEIDVFGGQFDTYVPLGSTVSVATRRVVVAAAAASFAMPTPSNSRRNK